MKSGQSKMLELGSFFESWKISLSTLQSSFLETEDYVSFVFDLVTEFMEALVSKRPGSSKVSISSHLPT